MMTTARRRRISGSRGWGNQESREKNEKYGSDDNDLDLKKLTALSEVGGLARYYLTMQRHSRH